MHVRCRNHLFSGGFGGIDFSLFFGAFPGGRRSSNPKMLETRALDRIHSFSLRIEVFWPLLGFMLSKTRAPDRIKHFSLQTKVFQQSLSSLFFG